MKKLHSTIYVALLVGLVFAGPVRAGIIIVPDPDLTAGGGKQSRGIRTSELLNRVVRNPQGSELGQVNDLVFEKDGRVSYIVISENESEAGQLIPVPFGTVHFGGYENWLVLWNVDKAKLEHAPSIKRDEWKRLEDPEFKSEVFSYYGEQQRPAEKMPR